MRLLIIAMLTLLLVSCGPPSQSEFQRLEAQGDPVVQQIEQYKVDNGSYPSDLAQAGITLPEAGYGGWQYSVYDGGDRFSLSIGDYGKHSFTLFWDGDSWYRDT